jgi:hypothetical protein
LVELDLPTFLGMLVLGSATLLTLYKRLGLLRAALLLPIFVLAADRASDIALPRRDSLYFFTCLWTWAIIPSLLIPLALGVCTAGFIRDEKKVKRASGHCVKCDYDLTGNVSGVCPECGCKTEQT